MGLCGRHPAGGAGAGERAGTATLRELIAFLRQRYGKDISALNRAWRLELPDFEALEKGLFRAAERSPEAERDLSDFTGQMIDRYAGLPARYAREIAPRHLNLGMRFAHVNHPGMLRAARHFDVFSLNCYAADPTEALLAVQKALNMPVLIGEFHFGALDAGLPAPSLFHVKDQKARGDAYARYLTRAAAQPCSVGAHYFAYNDQPLWGRYDGENYQFGFVDVCNRPYRAFRRGRAPGQRRNLPGQGGTCRARRRRDPTGIVKRSIRKYRRQRHVSENQSYG